MSKWWCVKCCTGNVPASHFRGTTATLLRKLETCCSSSVQWPSSSNLPLKYRLNPISPALIVWSSSHPHYLIWMIVKSFLTCFQSLCCMIAKIMSLKSRADLVIPLSKKTKHTYSLTLMLYWLIFAHWIKSKFLSLALKAFYDLFQNFLLYYINHAILILSAALHSSLM